MKIIFWASILAMTYVYILYPLSVWLLTRLFQKKYHLGGELPTVSIIIAAHNEERDIGEKIANTIEIDYPPQNLEIIVGSDGSTDHTNNIVQRYMRKGVRLLAFDDNRGKTAVQNDCVKKARNEILVFMDAATPCNRQALRKIVRWFSDSRVGAVAGRVRYTEDNANIVTQSQKTYWDYEMILKSAESRLGSLVGVDGPLYAVRRSLYLSLPEEAMSDFVTPLLIRAQGFDVVLENEATAFEAANQQGHTELQTRRRIVVRGLVSLRIHRKVLNPLRNPWLFWQLISRKVMRWSIGLFLMTMVFANLFLLSIPFYLVCFILCLGFAATAIVGKMRPSKCKALLSIPYYFSLINLSAVLGIFDFLRGRVVRAWVPERAHGNE